MKDGSGSRKDGSGNPEPPKDHHIPFRKMLSTFISLCNRCLMDFDGVFDVGW